MKRAFLLAAAVAMLSVPAQAAEPGSAEGQAALNLYRDVIALRTAEGQGKVPEMAARLTADLKAAGFRDEDIHFEPMGETGYLTVRYAGRGKEKPIAFLGHMDVVDARPEDWESDPFTLREVDGDFVGRGSLDNKFGVVQLTRAFATLKKSGYVPDRELYLAFSGDEETGQETTQAMVEALKPAGLEYALNSDAGGGQLTPDGKPLGYGMQVAEKTYATFEVEVRNEGGHSSRPRADNAIYDLADILKRVQGHSFPPSANPVVRNYLRDMAAVAPAGEAAMMRRVADDPDDREAVEALSQSPELNATLRTTCVATMLDAGHAENALPQRAKATVNCRILPGVPVEEVQAELERIGGNPEATWTALNDPSASPISEPRADVTAAVESALGMRFPGMKATPYQESGGTDGKYFRIAGVPTFAVNGAFMDMGRMRAHGLNELVPVSEFYANLDYWPALIKNVSGGAK